MAGQVLLEVTQRRAPLHDGAYGVAGGEEPPSAWSLALVGRDAHDDDVGHGHTAGGLRDGGDEAALDVVDVVQEVGDVARDGDGGRDVLGVQAAVPRPTPAAQLARGALSHKKKKNKQNLPHLGLEPRTFGYLRMTIRPML